MAERVINLLGLWKETGSRLVYCGLVKIVVAAALAATLLVLPKAAYTARTHQVSSQFHLPAGTLPSKLVIEPTDKEHQIVRAIDKAQNQIFVETYILSDKLIVRALERAAAQQVRVYVLLEPHPIGLGAQPQSVAMQLQAAGIFVRWTPSRFTLTHAKFLVLDDRVAIISTANFSRAGFHSDRDFVIFDRTRLDVMQASAIFRADWDDLPVRSTVPDLVVSPDDSRSKIAALIRSAHHVIRLYAEEMGDVGMEQLLVAAHRRAVSVEIVLEAGATPAAVQFLGHSGIRVKQLGSPYIHAKVLDVDDRLAFVGSENLSTESLDHNREVGLLIRGPDVGIIAHQFLLDWSRAR